MSTTHDPARQTVADFLLDSLERLVRRHRSLALSSGDGTRSRGALDVELITAEVKQLLARAPRSSWPRGAGASGPLESGRVE